MRFKLTLMLLAIPVLLALGASAQEVPNRKREQALEPKRSIVGSWEVTVTSDNVPGAPPPFLAYFTYDSGEGFVETDNLAGGNGHGYWEKNGRNKVKWRMLRPLYDPTFKLIGTFDVTEHIALVSANEYEGQFVAKLLDPSGNVINVIPGRTTAVRIEFEDEND